MMITKFALTLRESLLQGVYNCRRCEADNPFVCASDGCACGMAWDADSAICLPDFRDSSPTTCRTCSDANTCIDCNCGCVPALPLHRCVHHSLPSAILRHL